MGIILLCGDDIIGPSTCKSINRSNDNGNVNEEWWMSANQRYYYFNAALSNVTNFQSTTNSLNEFVNLMHYISHRPQRGLGYLLEHR